MEQNTHTRLIQDWINLETEVEQEHLRPPLCRWAAKSFSVGQAPYEEEISHELPWWGQPSPWTCSSLASAKACALLHQAFKMHRDGESIGQEARLHPGQDTCPLRDTHPIHSHLKTGKDPWFHGKNYFNSISNNIEPNIEQPCFILQWLLC